MKKNLLYIAAFLFLFNPLFAQNTDKITWHSFEDAAKLKNESRKKIFIDIFTDWCGWCKVLDKSTFPDTTIIRLMNKYFIAVKLDAERKDTVVFNGYTFINTNPDGYRSTHQLASSLLKGRLMYPSMCFLTDSFGLITTVQSYKKPSELEPILEYLGSDKYLTMKYDTFLLSYKVISGASTTSNSLNTTKSVVLNKLNFSSGTSEINKEAYSQLDSIATYLKSNANIKIEISGYTDNVGLEASNKTLSENRAKAVYEYFVSIGIENTRMTYAGYGPMNPVSDNTTEEGRKKNRRIEIKFIAH